MKKKTDILLLILVAMLTAGCSMIDDDELSDEPVAVSLSFAVSNINQNTTRQSDVVVQDGSARTIQFQKIIPFAIDGNKVTTADTPRFGIFGAELPPYEPNTNNRFYYYENCSFLSGVNAFLVYGKGTLEEGGDAVNGALVTNLSTTLTPADITFSPKQIRSTDAIHDEAWAIAEYLTKIARTEGWSSSPDAHLRTYYLNFTGQGSEGATLMAGSANNIEKYVARLRTLIEAEPASTLRTAILASIDDESKSCLNNNYPRSIGLPDGAAALRWEIPTGESEYAFVPQTVTTTEAAINSLSRFAYPAELYYYGNSLICTSIIDNRKTYYDRTTWGTSNTDENTVLSAFEYDPGVVSPNTQAVAIKDPVQYAVARLDAKIKATSYTLKDASDDDVTFDENSFPLTGIIVGGQRPVGFDFAPINNHDLNVRFVYDSQISTNTGDTPYHLTTAESHPVHTLLLQSYDGEDVTFALEFQNNSGVDFTGVDGIIIYNGTKFYLVGELRLEDATGDNIDKTRVFTQDQTTTATMTINGLARAYNVLPNLLSPQLEIGVAVTTSWIGSTPTTVIFE